MFRDVVYYGVAWMSKKQYKIQPTLIMSRRDWEMVSDPSVTHDGAFGRDFDMTWTKQKIDALNPDLPPQSVELPYTISRVAHLLYSDWVVVWKFPGDLNYLKGYRIIYNAPLPVGCYGFWDDAEREVSWWSPPIKYMDPVIPKDGSISVEKIRYDLVTGGSVHYLETGVGDKVAMIGSHFFIGDLWSVQGPEKARVAEMLQRLHDVAQIYAFPCYSQHHAIVFYMDIRTGERITPERMAVILKDESRRGLVLQALLSSCKPERTENLLSWAGFYSTMFTPCQ